jgi:hypothetical protein
MRFQLVSWRKSSFAVSISSGDWSLGITVAVAATIVFATEPVFAQAPAPAKRSEILHTLPPKQVL